MALRIPVLDGTGREVFGYRPPAPPDPAPKKSWKRRLAVAALFVPMMLWHWPRLIAHDLAAGYRAGRDRR